MELTLLAFILSIIPASRTAPTYQCSRSVRVVGPEWAVPGQPTAVLVTLPDAGRTANVTLRLVTSRRGPSQQLLARNTVTLHGDGIVGISVPADASGPCWLETLVDCPSEDLDCLPLGFSKISLLGPVRDVIIRPTSNYYKPGENIEFWILALDHDLRLASDVTGNVYIRDPSGVRTAIWEDVPLDDGVKRFEGAVSEWGAVGRWRLEVEAGGAVFWRELNVSLARGSKDPALPELPIAEEHYVELRFSSEMRRRYKPGLPFMGKVEAVSSERAVRVRVKVLDNTTAIYSQDIDMSRGEGTFLVPAILSDSPLITLQAELVSVGGKEIDSHYVLAKEPIYKWNSTSSCYLLVQGMEDSLQPGQEAGATVLSSCPCDRELHYVITTEGHVTYWTEHRVQPQPGAASHVNIDGTAICKFSFKFMVEAVMAPVSHLLVYYVTDSGEPISDVISFDVKLLHKQVTLNMESRKLWYPMENMDVQVLSELGSLVCVIGGRGGDVHLQKTAPGMEVDFAEAGVSFFEPRCSTEEEDLDARPRAHHSVMPDAGLEQLWFWHCFNYTEEIEAKGIHVRAPEEAGKWALWALAVSPTVGLRYSTPVAVSVFRPVDVEFHLPASLRAGEALEVDVKIGNNVNSCVDVNSLLTLSEGAHFVGSNQPYVAEKLRLGPHGATSLVVRVVPTTAGIKNFTVELTAYHSETCQSTTSELKGNHTLVSNILKQAKIKVHGEGLKRVNTESAYFCANEQMVVSTRENFRYEFVTSPRNREGIIFEVKAGRGVFMALSDAAKVSAKMYQIVIGDNDNTMTWIGKGKHGYSVHLQTTSTPGILSSDEARTFWLSWERGVISLGKGPAMHVKPIIKWRMDKKMKVAYIGLATSWGQAAEFRMWNYNDEAGFSQVLHLDVPRSVLPGSETGSLLISGGLTLPTALTKINIPSISEYSSLATVVAALAPLVIRDLSNNQSSVNHDEQKKIDKEIGAGIQKLLSYRRKDGSFSDHHYLESHWSSVAVLEVLGRAQGAGAAVDPELVTNLKSWVEDRQQSDGSFPPGGGDPPTDNGTHLASAVRTTALTLITLLDIGLESSKDSMIALKAKTYLEGVVEESLDGWTLAMLCRALAGAKSDRLAGTLVRLQNASTNEDGEFGWPRPQDADPDWLYDEPPGARRRKPPVSSNLWDFQASLYTLMTYTQLGDLKSAEPVARYLFYRSHLLDTHSELVLTAVKAFSEFGWLALDRDRKLTVSLATSGMELTDTLELRPSTSHQILSLPSLPTKVFVYATGAGCATVQGCVSYSTYSPIRSNSVLEIWAGVTEEILPRRNSIQDLEGKLPLLNIKTCIKWKGSEPSGVIRMEVHMFSGFELASVIPNELDLHFGSNGERVWFTLANVSSSCAVCVGFWARSAYVVGRLRPALARAYPATRTDLAAEVFFHTSRGSPLLSDITDDDLITWFGSLPQEETSTTSADFSELCVCGDICSENSITKPPITTEEANETDIHLQEESGINDFTDIIIFSDLHENFSTITGGLDDLGELGKDLEVATSEEYYSRTEPNTVTDSVTDEPTEGLTETTTPELFNPTSAETTASDQVTGIIISSEEPNAMLSTPKPINIQQKAFKVLSSKLAQQTSTLTPIRSTESSKLKPPTPKRVISKKSTIPKKSAEMLEVNKQNPNKFFVRRKHNSTIAAVLPEINSSRSERSSEGDKTLIFISQKEKSPNNSTNPPNQSDADSIIIQGKPDNTTKLTHWVNQPTGFTISVNATLEPENNINPMNSANKAKAERELSIITKDKQSLNIMSETHKSDKKISNLSGG